MFKNIKIEKGQILFDEFREVRQMKMEKAPVGKTEAKTTLIVKGQVSIENALKAALDKAVISFRKSLQAGFDPEKGQPEFDKWMQDYNGAEMELELDAYLSPSSRAANPVAHVKKAISKQNTDSLIAAMVAKGLTPEEAQKAIAAFLD